MDQRQHPKPPPAECPVCGAEVPPNARACPECGADERSGWNEDETEYDGLDLPEDAFATDEMTDISERKPRLSPKGVMIMWLVIGAVMAIVFAYLEFAQG